MEKNIEMTKKITDRKILLDPIRKEKYMSDFNARQSFYRNMLDQNVKFFMQIDSDASGSISWQEFLAHAARYVITHSTLACSGVQLPESTFSFRCGCHFRTLLMLTHRLI